MVTGLHDAEREKRQRKSFHRLSDPLEYSSKFMRWKKQRNCVNKSPEFLPQIFELNES